MIVASAGQDRNVFKFRGQKNRYRVLDTVSIEDIRSEIGVGFADVIKEEDYVAAADSHKSLMSGAIDFLTFGRNEPMLHHYHNTYREALGLVPLEKLNSVKS